MQGFIKLHRKILNWEWYSDSYMVHLFIHLLFTANHKDGKWRGIEIKRGQLITGRHSLCKSTGISPQSVRTCLIRLKSTNEIAIQTTNRYSIITLCNYELYQKKQPTKQPTKQQTINNQLTNGQPATNHKQECIKNEKNEKNALFEKIKIFFGLEEEQYHYNKWCRITAFLNELDKQNKTAYFEKQFSNYQKYKTVANEKIHGFESFIENGWDAENWEHKLIEFKKISIPKL